MTHCPACNATDIHIDIEQGIREHALRWRETITCNACGEASSLPHDGLPPREVRATLLTQHGTYSLRTAETLTLTDLRCLQKSTGISLPEMVAVKKRTPGILFTGTQMEVTFMRDCLPEGIAEVAPVEAAPAEADLSAAISQPHAVWERSAGWRGSGKAGCDDEDGG